MATVEDKLDKDGILRSILSKDINGTAYALYPRTHADSVLIDDTTVELKIKTISSILSNIQSITTKVNEDLSSLVNSTYDKEYITSTLDTINETINSNGANIIRLQQIISNMSYYTKDEVDQEIKNIAMDVNKYIKVVDDTINQLSTYINTNFDNTDVIGSKLRNINQILIEFKELLNTEFNDYCNQLQVDVLSDIDDKMSTYYTISEVDSKVNKINDDINTLEDKFRVTKGGLIVMNGTSENNVNDHVDLVKKDIINNTNNNLELLTNSLSNQFTNSTKTITSQNETLIGSLGELNSSVNSSLNAIKDMLTSLGASSSITTYESADEEAY